MLTGYFVIPSAKGAFEPPPTSRALFGGGNSNSNVIDYIDITSTGNATDFGDLTVARQAMAAVASRTRGVWLAGVGASIFNTIDYVTIATTGNATDFGDLTYGGSYRAACSSTTVGLTAGGSGGSSSIYAITIATTGNATSFGDSISVSYGAGGFSNGHGGLA
jgi:hypothetical protein